MSAEPMLMYDETYEIINGEEVMLAAARPTHSSIVGNLLGIIHPFLKGKRCKVYDDTFVKLDRNNTFVPDLLVVCDRNKIKAGYIEGAPDFVAEILSQSTQKRDVGIKKDTYERCGVKEYWLINPWDKSVTVYRLTDGRFELYNIYRDYTEEELAEMDERELAATELTLKLSLYDDLEIPVRDIFYDIS